MPKLAAFRGDVVFAPPKGRRCASRRPDRWLDRGLDAGRAARRRWRTVIRRHLAVYGPASRETFARWFGMASAAQAGRLIAALGDEVAEVSVEGFEGWMLRADVDGGGARRSRPASSRCCRRSTSTWSRRRARRRPVLAAEHKDRVYRRQGWLSPVLLVDGRIAGVWRHEAKHGEVERRRSSRSAPSATTCAPAPSARRRGWRTTSTRSSCSAGSRGCGARLGREPSRPPHPSSVPDERAARGFVVGAGSGVGRTEHAVEREQAREAVAHARRDGAAELLQRRDPARDEDLEARVCAARRRSRRRPGRARCAARSAPAACRRTARC